MRRLVVLGLAHHCTQRGNRRQDVFHVAEDRRVFLQLLGENCRRHALRLLGYCLMTNHTHVVAVPGREDSLARALGRTHNDYARYLHVKLGTSGHLFQNRFFSAPLSEAHQWSALAYVEQNPVRAGLVTTAWEWAWSSAQAHVTGVDGSGLLDLEAWRWQYTPARWRDVLMTSVGAEAFAERLRTATFGGRPLGEGAFLEELEARTGRRLRPAKPGPLPRARAAGQA